MKTEKENIIVYIDESGIKNTLRNEYAWSPRGELVKDERKGRATEKLNIVAGLSGGTLVAPMMYKCSMDSDLFNFWLEHQLLPKIPKNSLIVMDNASFHTSEKTKELVVKFSCRLLFLPPYSPDLNPIEHFWAFMKAKIKKIADGIKSLSVCVETFFQTI
ncbi:MAG TPA: IS630 family transposase [Methanosarcina sp.]|nr:IS630 family transposase [Methanosarcina sp.]